MAELDFKKLPHAMALTGPSEKALEEALRIASQLVGDPRIGILRIEPENRVIKIEAAHRVNDFLSLTRVTAARAVIVLEAQFLNPQATNAMLKIVEEPPANTYFFFLTPEISQLMPTLRSRLQVLRMPPEPRMIDESLLELRDQTVAFARSCFAGRREGLAEFLDVAKDRDSAADAAYLLQLVLRDWSVGEKDHGFPNWDAYSRVELWREAHQIEADLSGHIDRALAFENFFYRASHAVD